MARQRSGEDPNEGRLAKPKLTVVGRLQGTVEGRPFDVQAEGQGLALSLDGLGSVPHVLRAARLLLPGAAGIDYQLLPPVKVRLRGLPAVTVKLGSPIWRLFFGVGQR